MRLLIARWVFPISSPPIADGAVAIGAGQIVDVGSHADLTTRYSGAQRWDLGEAALLPGLVNCHTHLELPELPLVSPNGSFVSWLVALIERRRALSLTAQARAAETGARLLLESGTTCVGEVSSAGQSLGPVLRLGLRGVVYREILGLPPEEADIRCEDVRVALEAMLQTARGGKVRVGLSPHSPYSLSEELFSACARAFRDSSVPWCIHAAESLDEVEFLATGGGAIPRHLYRVVGCSSPPPRRRARSPVAYLEALGALASRPLLVHAVHVDAEDRRRMAAAGVGVAHCPRSNQCFSDGVAPVPELLSEGIPVGLGTDSLASVPTLDLWDEMRAALAVHAGRLAPGDVLEMATLGGARALGLADQVGSLEAGKRADCIAVSVGSVTASDPVGSVIAETRGENILLALVDGEVRHSRLEAVPCA